MPHLIAVAGLPGSGKSHYCYRLAAEHGYAAFDDVAQDRWKRWPAAASVLRDGRNVVVNSATFTDATAREEFEARVWAAVRGVVVEWRFFGCDPSACLTNILRDAIQRDRETVGRLRSFFRRAPGYVVPEGYEVIPVYKAESGPRVEYQPV